MNETIPETSNSKGVSNTISIKVRIICAMPSIPPEYKPKGTTNIFIPTVYIKEPKTMNKNLRRLPFKKIAFINHL